MSGRVSRPSQLRLHCLTEHQEDLPDTSDSASVPGFDDFLSDHDSDTEVVTSSNPKEGKAESSLSVWMKLAEQHARSLDEKKRQSASDSLPESSAPTDESRGTRSVSPPLKVALAQKAWRQSYKKPSPSHLRNEIYGSSACDDQSVSECDTIQNTVDPTSPELSKGGELDALLAQTGLVGSGSASRREGIMKDTEAAFITRIEAFVEKAYIDELTTAHLTAGSKAHKEGATKEKSALEDFKRTRVLHQFLADGGTLPPPVIPLKGAPGFDEATLGNLDSSPEIDQQSELGSRKSGAVLFADAWAKLPDEISYLGQYTATQFWNFVNDPVVRKTILEYKLVLALAAEEFGVLNVLNKVLVTVAESEDDEAQEGAKHIVDASDTITYDRRLSICAGDEEPTGLSETDILLAALSEVEHSLADQDYNNLSARKRYALTKGVKLNSQTLTELLIDFYKHLHNIHHSSKMNATEDDQFIEDSVIAKSKGKGKGKKKKGQNKNKNKSKKSEPLINDAATGDTTESDMPEEGLPIDGGEGKDDDWSVEDATHGKGKGKESSVLVDDQNIGTAKGKDDKLTFEDTMDGKGKDKENKEHTMDEAQLDAYYRAVYTQNLVQILNYMETMIRPQKASDHELDHFCGILGAEGVVQGVSPFIQELRWNR